TWTLTALQVPLPALVRVRVTEPAARSAAVGVYTAFRVVLLGLKLPAPPLQMPPVAPEMLPFRFIAGALAHTEASVPAFTIGARVKVMVRLLLADRQLPLP